MEEGWLIVGNKNEGIVMHCQCDKEVHFNIITKMQKCAIMAGYFKQTMKASIAAATNEQVHIFWYDVCTKCLGTAKNEQQEQLEIILV